MYVTLHIQYTIHGEISIWVSVIVSSTYDFSVEGGRGPQPKRGPYVSRQRGAVRARDGLGWAVGRGDGLSGEGEGSERDGRLRR